MTHEKVVVLMHDDRRGVGRTVGVKTRFPAVRQRRDARIAVGGSGWPSVRLQGSKWPVRSVGWEQNVWLQYALVAKVLWKCVCRRTEVRPHLHLSSVAQER